MAMSSFLLYSSQQTPVSIALYVDLINRHVTRLFQYSHSQLSDICEQANVLAVIIDLKIHYSNPLKQ